MDSKNSQKEQNLEAVKMAVSREIAKSNMGGVITPATYSYVGTRNPVIGRDETGDPINAGVDWYLLDTDALKELGIKKVKENYLVNYAKNEVLLVEDFLNKYDNLRSAICSSLLFIK